MIKHVIKIYNINCKNKKQGGVGMSLNDLATASNEKRLQNIMRLQAGFRRQEFYTVSAAAKALGGYSYNTVLRWAKEGDVPLIGSNNKPVVELTEKNKPDWLDKL